MSRTPNPAQAQRAAEHAGLDAPSETPGTYRDSPDGVTVPGADLRKHRSRDSRDTHTPPRRKHWTAPELIDADFPEPRWAVDGIVPEGVSLLAAPPKAGKSWLALGLAVAAASGGKALGRIDVKQGPVLYLALEDTGRRLQSRLAQVLGNDDPPDCLTFVTKCEPMPDGGAQKVSAWLEGHPGARLVIIDVLARVRGHASRDTPPYEADYRALAAIKQLADEASVPFIVVHHSRKASATDFVDEVSGTHGLAAAADSILVLRRVRGQADGILQVTGRDVEEASYALKFDPAGGTWHLLDIPAAVVLLGESRGTVLEFVRGHEGATPKQIAAGTALSYELAKKTCKRMADAGQLDTNGQGAYFLPVVVPSVPDGPTVPGVPGVPVAGQDVEGPESEPETALLAVTVKTATAPRHSGRKVWTPGDDGDRCINCGRGRNHHYRDQCQ